MANPMYGQNKADGLLDGVRGNQATLKALLEQEEKPTWVTCRYFERSIDNIPRFPVVIDWGVGTRED